MVSGPTGSGKTLAVQQAAKALGLIVHILGGDVSGGYGGVGENAATSWWDVACLFNVLLSQTCPPISTRPPSPLEFYVIEGDAWHPQTGCGLKLLAQYLEELKTRSHVLCPVILEVIESL